MNLWFTTYQIHLQCPTFLDEPLIYHIPNTSPVSYLLRWTSDLPHTKYISSVLSSQMNLWFTTYPIHLQCPTFSDEALIYHIPNASPVSYLLRWTSDLPHTKCISSVLPSQMKLWFTTYQIHLQCSIFSDEPLIYHIPNISPVSYLLRWTSDLPHTQYISSVLSSQMNLWFTTYQIYLQCPIFSDEPLIYHIPNISPIFFKQARISNDVYSNCTMRTISNTYAKVAQAQSCANHVQHIERLSHATCRVMCHAVRRDSSAIKFDRV